MRGGDQTECPGKRSGPTTAVRAHIVTIPLVTANTYSRVPQQERSRCLLIVSSMGRPGYSKRMDMKDLASRM
jgi:hypothetical protein